MKEVIVSISCITYNHAPYIRQCIEGFLMQKTNFAFEILIHDDASTDDTQKIIREYELQYPDIIKPIYREKNLYSQGVRIMNRFNFERAKGKYIAICEGDDYWTDPLKLQKQVDLLERDKGLAFCAHYVNRVNSDGKVLKKAVFSDENELFEKNEVLQENFSTMSLVFRNVRFPFTEGLLKAFNGDIVFITLLSTFGGAARMGFCGGDYRVHDSGVYSKNSLIVNTIRSIQTRRALINSNTLEAWQIDGLNKNIIYRKKRAIRFCLKKLKIKSLYLIMKA